MRDKMVEKYNEFLAGSDYKDRFKAEVYLLEDKIKKLESVIKYYDAQLDFEPSCSYDLLHKQLVYMKGYRDVLLERAEIEDIKL